MKKIVREPKWSRSGLSAIVLRERKRKQRDTASEESKAKEKESDRLRKKRCIQEESRVTLHLAHFLKLFRPPLCHLHRYLHVVTTDIYLHISRYPSARGKLCTCVFLVKVFNENNEPRIHKVTNVRTLCEVMSKAR